MPYHFLPVDNLDVLTVKVLLHLPRYGANRGEPSSPIEDTSNRGPIPEYVNSTHPAGGGPAEPRSVASVSIVSEAITESTELPTGFALPKTNPSDTAPLSLDVKFELLKNKRRRDLLCYLEERDEVVTLSDLAEHVAAIENGVPESQLSSQQRKRVYVALYQCHLPILDRADVVNFNQARGLIERTPRADQLRPYLAEPPYRQDPWPKVYVAVSIASVVGLSVISMAGSPLWMLTPAMITFAVVLLGVSLVHWRSGRSMPVSGPPGGELVSASSGE